MALLTWSSKYSVGVQRMDEQHTVLFGMLNDLHESMMKGQAKQIVGPLLKKLAAYTQEHFTAEEGLMRTSGYAGLAQHRVLIRVEARGHAPQLGAHTRAHPFDALCGI